MAEKEITRNGKIILTDDQRDYELPELVKQKHKGHLAAIQREGANCQIQSVNADFTKMSMAAIRKACRLHGYDARMYNSVYDEIVLDIHKSCATEVHELQKKIMIEEADKMLRKVPMQVEGHLAACWTK